MREYINIVNDVIDSVLLNKDTEYIQYVSKDIVYKKYDWEPINGLSNVAKDIERIRKSSYIEHEINKIDFEENDTTLKAMVLVSVSFLVAGNINYSVTINIDKTTNQITNCIIEALSPLYFVTSSHKQEHFKDLDFNLLEKIYDHLFIVDFEEDICFNIKTYNKIVYSKCYQKALENVSPLDFGRFQKTFDIDNYIVKTNEKILFDESKIPADNKVNITFNLLFPKNSVIYTADMLFIYNDEHHKYYGVILFKNITQDACTFNHKLVSIIRQLDDNTKMLSHDLRNIGNNIAGYTTLVQMALDKNPSLTKDYINHINISTNLLNDLVKSMLDSQCIDSGVISINRKEFAIADLCSGINNEVLLLAKNKNINFNIILENIIFDVIYTDEIKLKQILINLITNGIKFTNDYGNVTLIINQERINQHYYNLILKVIDDGKGIKDEFIPNLFISYTKENKETDGYGLGLSIVKRLTNMLKGDISVKSKENNGTTFTVTIPLINTLKHK